VCSVLFADLVGFTPLSESRDPEAVRELLSRYFEVARTVVGRYGGVIEKFIGDAVMAVWGTPVATEGDTERAVRAALDLVAAVGVLGGEVGAPGLAARAGVVTGEVAVTLGAQGEGMVAGDAVNTAARVQSVAHAGSVLVDATTRRLATSAIGFEDAGAHELKGKTSPEQLWRATRVLSGVGGSQRVDGLEAPLIGRDAELRTIRDLFHASAERRSPRLVVVSGPAGVGKSRLGWEFFKYMDGLADSVFWHRGRCLSYGEEVAFWALAEIVRQRLGIAEEDTSEAASIKLAEGLDHFVADPTEREYVAVRLGRLLGVPVEADHSGSLPREELFAGWRLFFERLASLDPVVLLIEDAQHADPGLLDFIDHLVDWARDLPIFVLVFARPELEETRPSFGVGRNRATLTIDPLDGASMEALVDALVPGMPPAASSAITTHSEGIPLFAVETVRSLIDQDIVVPKDGLYRLVGEVSALSVPDSLHGLLAARLDALDAPTRSLVADASVLGSSFPPEALVAVSGQDPDTVRTGLGELVRRDVLEVSADPLSPQRGAYRFSQEMLRQVAYDTLSRRDKKTRHLAVAAHLRTTFANDGEEISEVVARHYLDALAAGPEDPDAGAIGAEALAALIRAGERAGRSGAPRGAAAAYASAAALAADDTGSGSPAERALRAARLWELAAIAIEASGDLDAAIADAESARRLYLDAGAQRDAARAQTLVGRNLRQAGRHREARTQLEEALTVLHPEPDADAVSALAEMASIENFSGGTESDRLSAEALALGQALDVDAPLLARLLLSRGIAHSHTNHTIEAVAYYREAARLAEQADAPAELSRALLNLADVLGASDPAGAAEAGRAAAGHARRVGELPRLGTAIANLVEALLELGEWDEAQSVLTAAIEDDGLGDHDFIRTSIGWLAGLRGDAEQAGNVLASLTRMAASEDVQDQADVALLEALTAAAGDRRVDTLAYARAVLSYADALSIRNEHIRWAWPLAARTARELNDTTASLELVALLDAHPTGHLPPLLRAERQLARACAAADAGDPDAGVALSRAVAELRQVGSPYHLAHALLDQATYLSRSGNHQDADAATVEARAIATRLGCTPLTRRAEVSRMTHGAPAST
jgi:class 3 adenylate cyclase/tetratricopeptide (TPR) repeat protein